MPKPPSLPEAPKSFFNFPCESPALLGTPCKEIAHLADCATHPLSPFCLGESCRHDQAAVFAQPRPKQRSWPCQSRLACPTCQSRPACPRQRSCPFQSRMLRRTSSTSLVSHPLYATHLVSEAVASPCSLCYLLWPYCLGEGWPHDRLLYLRSPAQGRGAAKAAQLTQPAKAAQPAQGRGAAPAKAAQPAEPAQQAPQPAQPAQPAHPRPGTQGRHANHPATQPAALPAPGDPQGLRRLLLGCGRLPACVAMPPAVCPGAGALSPANH